MTTFDERERGFENKFAHDKELSFKIMSLRNRLLGRWAAAKLGKDADEAERYALDIVTSEVGSNSHAHVVEKLLHDFAKAALPLTSKDIYIEMERLMSQAMAQVMGH